MSISNLSQGFARDFSLLKAIFSDRALVWRLSVALLVVAGLFSFRLLAGPSTGMAFVRYWGYWLMLLLVVSVGWVVWRMLRASGGVEILCSKRHFPAYALALLGAVLWHVHEPHRLKILYDEFGYSAIAHTMHLEREAAYPTRAHYFEGDQYVLGYGVDKRPLLFPFLVSVIHDLSGYRKSNVFILNGALSFLNLLIVYGLLAQVSSRRIALCGQIFWIGFPLLPQVATSGGYDLLNITLLQAWLWLGLLYMERKNDGEVMNAFLAITILLAQVRNESVFYMLGAILVIWMKWRKAGRGNLSWGGVAALSFLIVPIAANVVFAKVDQMRETKPGQDFFSMEYMADNLSNAVAFMYKCDLAGVNSLTLAAAGTFCTLLFLVGYSKSAFGKEEAWAGRDQDRVLFVFTGMIACVFLIYMSMFWGSWEDPIVSRFSLPIWLLFLVLSCRVVSTFRAGSEVPSWWMGAVALWTFAFLLPASAKSAATNLMITSREYEFLEAELSKVRPGDVLVISPSSLMPIVDGHAACNLASINEAPWKLQVALELGLYKEVWVAGRFYYDYRTGTWVDEPKSRLSGGFELETVAEMAGGNSSSYRIRRIVSGPGKEEAQKRLAEALTPRPQDRLSYFKAVIRLLP